MRAMAEAAAHVRQLMASQLFPPKADGEVAFPESSTEASSEDDPQTGDNTDSESSGESIDDNASVISISSSDDEPAADKSTGVAR